MMAFSLDPLDLIFDEEEDNVWNDVIRRPRWIQERKNHFDDLDDVDFITRFRLRKHTVLEILEQIEDRLEFPEYNKNLSISPMGQLLTALRFYATGSTQLSAGDFSGCSKSTAHRIVHRVSAAIAELGRVHIKFPQTPQEIVNTQNDFYQICRFLRVLGALDCSHVKIYSPGGDQPELFRNRKGYFSFNCQAICNATLEFTDIVARWPGKAHDVTIFNNSFRKNRFDGGTYGNGVLVADGGYGSKQYMMVPLGRVDTPAERLYNESQIRTRNVIERAFGVWKRRFPVLALGIRVSLEKSMSIIVATAVLHNIAIRAREELPPDDVDLNLPAPWEELFKEGYMDENFNDNPNNVDVDPNRNQNDVNPNRNRNRSDLARVELITTYFQALAVRNRQRHAREQ